MPTFSGNSLVILRRAHPDLQKVLYHAIERLDFRVICSTRGKAEQEDAFRRKCSKVHFGNSPHNFYPSLAVDLFPAPYDWNNLDAFRALGKQMLESAKAVGVALRWGADWNRNGDWHDEAFRDWPHFELDPWRIRQGVDKCGLFGAA